MSQSSELVYTSAPKGLRPGSRGFCTVVMSDSMPAGLIGPLESLSAYRHVDSGGPSPINYMHVQMKVAGRPVNVLSRITEAPPDYTGRTNKIAHHVVVATTDRAAGGPAAVLRQSGFSIETWDGEVRKIPEPKTIPPADSPPRIARLWAEHSGDAGWAGMIASIFESQAPGPPLYLIYEPEQNAELLALVDEAICLLPESTRWNATFSTDTSELPQGVNCRLRCLIAGSAAATSLPPAAMTFNLSSGTLDSPTGQVNVPPPSLLVDAARSGQFASPAKVPPAEISTPGGQVRIAVPANQSTSFEATEPNFNVPPLPPSTPPPSNLPPPLEADSSSTHSCIWPVLTAVALLLLTIGGVAALHFLKTDSADLLASLNDSAGIENPPEVEVSPKGQPEPNVESEPEPEPELGLVMEPDAEAEAEAEANAISIEVINADEKIRKEFERLTKKILDGKAFLGDEGDQSIVNFSDKVKYELQRIKEQQKQLDELSLGPSDEQLAAWLRAEDGVQQLAGFFDTRKKEVDALKQNLPVDDLNEHRESLAEELRAWNADASKWPVEQEKHAELIAEISDVTTVKQTIDMVRATAIEHLQASMSQLLGQYEKRTTEKNQAAALIGEKLDPLQKDLTANLQRDRDSHRLAIYFDGNSRRKEERLQIKPRCMITLDPGDLELINRLRVDDSNPILLSQSSDDVKLPGRFEGWLTVTRSDSEIVLKLNPRTIPQVLQQKHPMLQQLDQFVQQQTATFNSGKKLHAAFGTNVATVTIGMNQWRQQSSKDKDQGEKISRWEKAIEQMNQILTKSPARKLDDLYIEQFDQTVSDLQSIRTDITDMFKQFVTPNGAIQGKIDEHIENLEVTRDSYNQLKADTSLLDFQGQLVFGDASGGRIGDPTFQNVATFDLFFIPELVYGPPPKE